MSIVSFLPVKQQSGSVFYLVDKGMKKTLESVYASILLELCAFSSLFVWPVSMPDTPLWIPPGDVWKNPVELY